MEAVKNKLFLFQQKAVVDILTDEEIATSKAMIRDVQDIISKSKTGDEYLKQVLQDQQRIIQEIKQKLG